MAKPYHHPAFSDEDQPKPGDILLFKIPPYKPFFGDRFIQFAQRLRGAKSHYADTVHAAIVQNVKPLMIAHYTADGHSVENLELTLYKYHPYEIYRPHNKFQPSQQKKILNLATTLQTEPLLFDQPQQANHTTYSIKKMILAFLNNEHLRLPKPLHDRLVKKLNNKTLNEEICSTFVAKVIKLSNTNPKEHKTITSSYVLPSQLHELLDRDINFRRIQQKELTPQDQYDLLYKLSDDIYRKMMEQSSPRLFNQKKFHDKRNDIYRGLQTLQEAEQTPEKVLSVMLPLFNQRTGSGMKRPDSVKLLLAEAKRLRIDTEPFEALLRQPSEPHQRSRLQRAR